MSVQFFERGLIWPVVIVALLVGSAAMMGAFVFAAKSDGGAQVIDSYYDKAVAWDSLAAVRNEVDTRNWLPYLMLEESTGKMRMLDSTGIPVASLAGVVRLTRPHLSLVSPHIPLEWNGQDSTYVFPLSTLDSGLWDFEFQVRDQIGVMEFVIRKEIRASE